MLRNASAIFNLGNKKIKLKLAKKDVSENDNAKENISTIIENNDVNSLNKEDLIDQLNYMNQKLISLENIKYHST